MTNQPLVHLANLLSEANTKFAVPNHEAVGEQEARNQTSRYSELFSGLKSIWEKNDVASQEEIAFIKGIINKAAAIVNYILEKNPASAVSFPGDHTVVISVLPVITRQIAQTILVEAQESARYVGDAKRISVEEIIAGICFEALSNNVIELNQIENIGANIVAAMFSYASARDFLRSNTEANKQFASATSQLSAQIMEARTEIAKTLENLSQHSDEQRQKAKSVATELEELNGKLADALNRIGKYETGMKENIDNLETALADKLRYGDLGVLWTERAEEAERSLRISICMFVALCAVGIITAIFGGNSIIHFVNPADWRTIFTSSSVSVLLGQQIARIVLITVPIAVYFWAIKLTVRFINRSMLLLDDASQRATIMASYLRLTREGVTDERALPMMLWALFRQVPGHGPDGIEPPDFTEVINAGLKKGIGG